MVMLQVVEKLLQLPRCCCSYHLIHLVCAQMKDVTFELMRKRKILSLLYWALKINQNDNVVNNNISKRGLSLYYH